MCSKTNLALTWIFFAMIVAAELEPEMDLDSRLEVCSRPLAEFMAIICRKFNIPQVSRTRRAALTLVGHRRKRQIIDECCKTQCTVAEMLEYCPVPSTLSS